MTITCPQTISVDNKVMNGVDKNNNLRGYYNVLLNLVNLKKNFW